MNDPLYLLQTELKLSEIESRLFLHLVKKGRRTIQQISSDLKCSRQEADKAAQNLENFGMIIQISQSVYMPLHPRFAVVNRYRKMCKEDNLPFHRNVLIDNIGVIMEKYFDRINV